jgi:O-antigen ligase
MGTRITGSIGGIFSNPNDLALHLVTMTPLALALAFGTSNIFKKLFYATAALIFVVGIVATFSRGGVLGLVVACMVMALKYVRRMRAVVVVGVLVLMLGAVALTPGAFRERIMTTGDASAVSRTDDLKRSVYLAIRHPLLGVGLGNYVFYSNQAKATHNAYTQVASEMGLIAAGFYVLFIVWPLRPLLRIERETRDSRKDRGTYYLALGLQASLIGYMVSSFFASVPYLWYAYYLVAYSIAVRRIYDSQKATDLPCLKPRCP